MNTYYDDEQRVRQFWDGVYLKCFLYGTMHGTFFLFICFFCFGISLQSQENGRSLHQGFADPPNEARPRGYWVLVNGNFSLSQMTEELKEFKDKGMGGVDLWDVAGWVDENKVVPAGPKFMGEQSLQAIAHGIREGKRLGLLMGLTISSSWNAGGDWVRPEDGVMGLYSSKVELSGGKRLSMQLPFPSFPKTDKRGDSLLLKLDGQGRPELVEEVAVLAYPSSTGVNTQTVLDLAPYVEDGLLNWQAPEGNWVVERFVGLGTGQPLMRPSPNSDGLMIDHFSATAMRKNMDFFFEKLEAKLGPLQKSGLQYLYTDSYEANSGSWTKNMANLFLKANGYNMVPYLPTLTGQIVDDQETTDRFLFDFRKILSDLIIDNHYALGKKMANEKGIGFIAEAGGPGPPVHNTPFESLRALGALTVPRGEFWFDPSRDSVLLEQLQIIKGPASAAHLYGQPRVEAEAFTGIQLWQFGPGDLKQTADRAMAEGLTSFIYHTTPHIPPEAGAPGWVYNFGTLINTTRTWWPKSKPFHEYLGRSCFLLQQGHFVGDVLFYYGDDAPNFIDHLAHTERLGFGFDYDGLNTDVLMNKLKVVDGYFVLPHGPKYKVLVLPEQKTMKPEVLEKLRALLNAGGTVIGNPPNRSHGLFKAAEQDAVIRQLATSLWKGRKKRKVGHGWLYNAGQDLPAILTELGLPRDVDVSLDAPENKLRFIHRTGPDFDIYFLQNRLEQPLTFEAEFRSVLGSPELWDPTTGKQTRQELYMAENGVTKMPMQLEGNGSVFVVFRKDAQHPHYVRLQKDGIPLFPKGSGNTFVEQTAAGLLFEQKGTYVLTDKEGQNKVVEVATGSTSKKLDGAWEMRFAHGWGAPQSVNIQGLKSWTEFDDEFIKHFSGTVSYHHQFNMEDALTGGSFQTFLDLGDVSKIAEVFLNGHRVQTLWHAPYKVDVTDYLQAGTNYLVVEVANVAVNRLIGDAKGIYGELKRTHTNITRAPNPWMTPYPEASLVPSGLMGPVKLITKPKMD